MPNESILIEVKDSFKSCIYDFQTVLEDDSAAEFYGAFTFVHYYVRF